MGAVFGIGSNNNNGLTEQSQEAIGLAMDKAEHFLFANNKPLIRPNECETGILSEEVIKRILCLHSEMSIRLFTLLPSEQAGPALEEAFKLLLHLMHERYIEPCLLVCWENSRSSSKGFDARTFSVLQSCSSTLSTELNYCQNRFLPLIVIASGVSYRSMVQNKIEACARVTGKMDRLLGRELEAALSWIETCLLCKQQKSDFKPRPDDLESMAGPTVTCRAVCDFVTQITLVVNERLDPINADSFFTELGSGLHLLLLSHLKTFTISDMGAMVLQRYLSVPFYPLSFANFSLLCSDLKRYRNLIDKMGEAKKALIDRFGMLLEIGHIFMVRPENLRSILTEGYLSKIDTKLLYPYFALRSDFNSANIRQLFPDMERNFTNLFA